MLGYEKDPTNSGKLIVVQDEVKHAQRIFKDYLTNASLQATAKMMNDNGIKPKVILHKRNRHIAEGRWTVNTIRNVLTNLAYIGKREINRGNKDEDQEYLKPWQRYQIVEASWKGIVCEDDFYRVQNLMEDNRQKERTRLKDALPRFYLLSGIIKCGECSRALIGQTSHGRSQVHRYYGHKKEVGEATLCKYSRFRADEIEQAVVQHLDEILLRAGHLDSVAGNIHKMMNHQNVDGIAERDRVQKDLVKLESDVEAAFSLFIEMGKDTQAASLVKEKLERLAEKKRKLTNYREEVLAKIQKSHDINEARTVIENNALAFNKGWKKANPVTQKRLLRRLVDKLIYSGDGLHAFYVVAKDTASTVIEKKLKGASELASEAYSKSINVIDSLTKSTTGMFMSNGASVVCNGGGG
ncbi:MAG: recombinase family protein [Pseudomonadota bacterium]|nr:recombinase family protein [Pseudomonadota bacterium]